MTKIIPSVTVPLSFTLLGASEITANLSCDCVYLYSEGCVICSTYLRQYMERLVHVDSYKRVCAK